MSSFPNDSKIIIGIDPGTRITGYGIIRVGNRPQLEPIDFGCIRPPAHLDSSNRYLALFEGLELLLEKYMPNAVAVETQFVYKNVQSALKLAMVRGVVLFTAAKRKIPISEYAPRKVKLAVGNGAASKEQVQKMIQLLLNLPVLPEPEDAADALALAICHANTLNLRKSLCMNSLKER